MAPRSKVNMQMIAEEFNVSKVTVSKALNDKEGVSIELRDKIKARAMELGYHINYMARGLKNNRTYNIGLLVAERYIKTPNNYYFEVAARLTKTLSDFGYTSIMEFLDSSKEKNNVLPTMYETGKIDGLIIIGECRKEYLELFVDFPIPVLFFDFYSREVKVDSLVTDNFSSGLDITNLLIKNGHRQIAFIGNIYSTSSIKERFLGYYKALLDANITLNYDLIISDRNNLGELEDFELPKQMPTAFVCNNDELAYNLIGKLKKHGYLVPKDISVVTFDNTIYSTLGEVKLTSFDSNVETMVEKAAKAILKKIEEDKEYDCILVKGTIIKRDSIKNINI